ncbi:MAG: hypothetical protein ACJAW3_000249 [Lentimonas sp.]|jgi:hypothetical protein
MQAVYKPIGEDTLIQSHIEGFVDIDAIINSLQV